MVTFGHPPTDSQSLTKVCHQFCSAGCTCSQPPPIRLQNLLYRQYPTLQTLKTLTTLRGARSLLLKGPNVCPYPVYPPCPKTVHIYRNQLLTFVCNCTLDFKTFVPEPYFYDMFVVLFQLRTQYIRGSLKVKLISNLLNVTTVDFQQVALSKYSCSHHFQGDI